jgi:integrase
MRTRERITTGVYRDQFGIAIIVSVNGTPREFRKDANGLRYASNKGASWYRDERARILAREQHKEARKVDHSDTFRADVERFLNTLSGGHRLNTEGYMKHWTAFFGDHQRNTLTEIDVQTAFAKIKKGASTKRHIRRALVKFYDTLNGITGTNPARVLTPPPKPAEKARAIPYEMIEKIFAALTPSRARARLKVLAYVGLPQKQIAQLQPSDLRLSDRELIAHPRRKGAGAAGRAIPLSDVAIAALREFASLNAFGTFQNSQLVRTFKLGAKRAGVTLPDDARPYDLRHSFLTEVYRNSGDPFAVSELGLHATLQQTARYTKGALSERATKAIAAVPRFSVVAEVQNPPKRSISVAEKRTPHVRKGQQTRGRKARKSRGRM